MSAHSSFGTAERVCEHVAIEFTLSAIFFCCHFNYLCTGDKPTMKTYRIHAVGQAAQNGRDDRRSKRNGKAVKHARKFGRNPREIVTIDSVMVVIHIVSFVCPLGWMGEKAAIVSTSYNVIITFMRI